MASSQRGKFISSAVKLGRGRADGEFDEMGTTGAVFGGSGGAGAGSWGAGWTTCPKFCDSNPISEFGLCFFAFTSSL